VSRFAIKGPIDLHPPALPITTSDNKKSQGQVRGPYLGWAIITVDGDGKSPAGGGNSVGPLSLVGVSSKS